MDRNLERICESISETLNFKPWPSAVWNGLKSKDVNRRAREFIWKGLHDAHRIGRYWANIPTLQHRAMCMTCNVEESMEHILLECKVRTVRIIWGLVRALATRKGLSLPRLEFGVVMAGHMFMTKYIGDRAPKGADRLMRIAITESAYLIWKIRCERVIGRNMT